MLHGVECEGNYHERQAGSEKKVTVAYFKISWNTLKERVDINEISQSGWRIV
jgi:hypothetical protein